MQTMERMIQTSDWLAWLDGLPIGGAVTGFDAIGWPASTWVLHAMYENADLIGLGTHDEQHRRRLESSDVAPVVIGNVSLEETTTVAGTPLGFVVNPGPPWLRRTWAEYLTRFQDFTPDRGVPPCHRWFPSGSWPVAIEPPPEGSLDGESMEALLSVLAGNSPEGADTECLAFYGSLPAADFDSVHLWKGPLKHLPDLIDARGGPYGFSPTNFWPVEREWFVWTDYDLQGTKVSGKPDLVRALHADADLECLDWQPQEVR